MRTRDFIERVAAIDSDLADFLEEDLYKIIDEDYDRDDLLEYLEREIYDVNDLEVIKQCIQKGW